MDDLQAAQFANDIARFYQRLAKTIGDNLHDNIGKLTERETSVLLHDQGRLISYSNTFFTLSDQIAFKGSDTYFTKVTAATNEVMNALQTIKTVNDVISITAGVIGLAGGIVSQNGSLITGSLVSIGKSIATAMKKLPVPGENA